MWVSEVWCWRMSQEDVRVFVQMGGVVEESGVDGVVNSDWDDVSSSSSSGSMGE